MSVVGCMDGERKVKLGCGAWLRGGGARFVVSVQEVCKLRTSHTFSARADG